MAPVLTPPAEAAAAQLRMLLAARQPDPPALRAAAAALVAAIDRAGGAGGGMAPPPPLPADDAFAAAGLDAQVLAALLAMTGPEVARDLLDRLLEDLESVRAAVDPAHGMPDPATLRAQAHVLVGLAGSVGATRLTTAARRMQEALVIGGNPDAARAEVIAALDAALIFLATHGPGLPARLATGA